jgi:hypothetical protein
MKGVKHYTKNGNEWTGPTHKMGDGTVHTGATHNKNSKIVVHKKDLKKKMSGGQVQGCGCPYGMSMGPNKVL